MLGQAERLYELNSLMGSKIQKDDAPKIISITSGKGGTGKSFIAGNMALDLASNGSSVLLVDLDINLGNQNVLFNINAKKNIYHYLTYSQDMEEIVQVCPFNSNLSLIFGESGKLDHPKLTEESVTSLFVDIRQLSPNFDIIIIDTSSGIEASTLQILLNSDEIILVTTPEPTSVMDGYVIFKLLKSNGYDSPTSVIVNKSFNISDADEAFSNLEKATKHFLHCNINYLGEISFSTDVTKSIQNQSILSHYSKSNKIINQITNITTKLIIPAIG